MTSGTGPFTSRVTRSAPCTNALFDVCDVNPLHDSRYFPIDVLLGHTSDLGHETQIAGDRHLQIQRRILRKVTNASTDIERLLEHVEAIDADRAVRGRH